MLKSHKKVYKTALFWIYFDTLARSGALNADWDYYGATQFLSNTPKYGTEKQKRLDKVIQNTTVYKNKKQDNLERSR